MTAHCHPLPLDSATDFLQLAARAICVRPGETASQGAARIRHLSHTAMGFEPRDGVEYILSILVFGHFNLILDSMSDAFQGQTEAVKTRAKSSIVALDRALLATLRELRLQRKRPVAGAPLHAPAETPAHNQAQTEPPIQAHGDALIRPQPPATPEPLSGQPPREPPPRGEPPHAAARQPATAAPLPGLPGQRPPREETAPDMPMPGPRHAALASTCLASGRYAVSPQARAPAPGGPMAAAMA